MDYSLYTDHSTSVKEYMCNVSDGVSLKVIDFTPQNEPPAATPKGDTQMPNPSARDA